MRVVLVFILVLIVAGPARAFYVAGHDPTLIVPSQRIGLFHLGMSRQTIEALSGSSPCRVTARYDASGRSIWLETNWGGECLVSDKIQVGLPFGQALGAFGKPDRIARDAQYPHATAVWITYEGWGIAFRVLGWHAGTLIQAIAVFPRLAARNSGPDRTVIVAPQGVIQPSSRR